MRKLNNLTGTSIRNGSMCGSRVLLVFVAVATIAGCQDKPATPAAPPPPVAKKLQLPEYYGVYVSDGDTLVDLEKGQQGPDLKPDVQFLVFGKSVAIGQGAVSLYRTPVQPPPHALPTTQPQSNRDFWEGLTRGAEQNMANLDAQMTGIPKNAIVVPIRTKPVADQREMIQIVPQEKLAPGLYLLEDRGLTCNHATWRFSVQRGLYVQGFVNDAQRALDHKDWLNAAALVQAARKVDLSNSEVVRLFHDVPNRLRAEVLSAIAEKQWNDAITEAQILMVIDRPAMSDPEPPADLLRDCLFTVNQDGTVVDNRAGLMWLKDGSKTGTWPQATDYCKRLTVGQHDDWRIPAASELKTLYASLRVLNRDKWRTEPFVWGRGYYWCHGPEGRSELLDDENDRVHGPLRENSDINVRPVRFVTQTIPTASAPADVATPQSQPSVASVTQSAIPATQTAEAATASQPIPNGNTDREAVLKTIAQDFDLCQKAMVASGTCTAYVREAAATHLQNWQSAQREGSKEADWLIGTYFAFGSTDHKDPALAIECFRRAAAQGSAAAMHSLGRCYCYGTGVPKSAEIAAEWIRKAAEAGDSSAMARLGRMYLDGEGLSANATEAQRWLGRAADDHNAAAMLELGQMFAGGRGVAPDDQQGLDWHQKAAEAGNPIAMLIMGVQYSKGNSQKQLYWYRKAARLGQKDAQEKLRALGKSWDEPEPQEAASSAPSAASGNDLKESPASGSREKSDAGESGARNSAESQYVGTWVIDLEEWLDTMLLAIAREANTTVDQMKRTPNVQADLSRIKKAMAVDPMKLRLEADYTFSLGGQFNGKQVQSAGTWTVRDGSAVAMMNGKEVVLKCDKKHLFLAISGNESASAIPMKKTRAGE